MPMPIQMQNSNPKKKKKNQSNLTLTSTSRLFQNLRHAEPRYLEGLSEELRKEYESKLKILEQMKRDRDQNPHDFVFKQVPSDQNKGDLLDEFHHEEEGDGSRSLSPSPLPFLLIK